LIKITQPTRHDTVRWLVDVTCLDFVMGLIRKCKKDVYYVKKEIRKRTFCNSKASRKLE